MSWYSIILVLFAVIVVYYIILSLDIFTFFLFYYLGVPSWTDRILFKDIYGMDGGGGGMKTAAVFLKQ